MKGKRVKMKIAGIICEYNPFHNGHKYLLEKAKKDGYAVVAVMSGNYTQRGELAVADRCARAEAAVRCGADLVLELPFPFAMSSAEFFAKGGISVLERVGAERIYFGSECGDAVLLTKAAKVVLGAEFSEKRAEFAHNEGVAKAYFDALGEELGNKTELLSNDILGIEYIKEINRRGLDIEPITVRRVGDRYRAEQISSEFASATAIRKSVFAGELDKLEEYMPSESLEVLKNSVKKGEAPVSAEAVKSAVLSFWRMADPLLLTDIAELGNGLEYRIKEAALASTMLGELEKNSATKKYTSAKIRRAILFGLLGVTKSDLDSEPQYTSVLGANTTGREILSALRKKEGSLKIVTKAADTPACRQYKLSAHADALYTLAMPRAQGADFFVKKKIYIE